MKRIAAVEAVRDAELVEAILREVQHVGAGFKN